MQFENRQFEKNIAKSKKSLEDFKKAMNFEDTSRNMEDFARSTNRLSFDGLASNIQKLTDRFTGLGDAGDYVLRRIRASIEGAAMQVETFVKELSTAQIKVGEGKYDALNKAVMTIVSTGKYTEEQAYSVFERLMTYTNETSYSFNDMVNQIATFTSAGQGLASSEKAMEGIANMAAKAGQGTQAASSAMGIFAKALGQGHLSLQQWQSLNLTAHVTTEEFRKTLADTAVEMGTLKKEGDKYYVSTKKGKKTLVEVSNLETTLNQQWATSAVLMKTLQKYYFEGIDDPNADWSTFSGIAAKAAQRALNLTDALNAMKEAVSGGWMDTFRLIFGDLTEAMELFTNIANRAIESLDKIAEFRNRVIKIWSRQGGRQSLIDIILGDFGKKTKTGAYGLLDVLDDVGKMVYDGFVDFIGLFAGADDRKLFKDPKEGTEYFQAWLGIQLKNITQSVENFLQGIRNWFNEEIVVGGRMKSRLQVFHEIIMGVVAALKLGYDIMTGLASFFVDIATQLAPSFNAVIGFFSDLGAALYGATAEAGDAGTIRRFFHDLAEEFQPLTDGINAVITALTDMFRVLLESDQANGRTSGFLGFIGEGLKFVAGIINSVGVPVLNFIKNIIETITALLTGDKSKIDPSKGIFGAVGDLISGIISGFSENGFETLHNRLEKVIGFFQNVNFGSLLLAILGGVSLASIIGMISRISKAFKRIQMFFEDPGGALKEGLLGNYEFFSERVLNFAKSIALIAGAVILLGSMNTTSLIQGVIAVTVIFGALALFTSLMSKIKGSFLQQTAITTRIFGIALGVAAIALAVSILVTALRPYANMNWDQYARIMAGLGGVLLELAAFMGLLRLLDIGTKGIKLAGIIGFSVAIGILVWAIQSFGNMNWDQYAKSMAGLGGILLELVGFMELMKLLDIGVNGIKLAGIIGFSVAIGILVLSVQSFANMNWEQYAKVMAGLGGVLTELVGFMGMLRLLDIGTNGIKLAGIIGFAIAIGILVLSIQPFVNLSWEQYAKAMAGLGGVLTEIIGFMELLKLVNTGAQGLKVAGIGVFSIAISILVQAIQPFVNLSWEQYAKAMAGLGGVLVELAAAVAVMSKIPTSGLLKASVAFAAISLVITTFAGALNQVRGMQWETIAAFAAGFAAVILAIAGALTIAGTVGNLKGVLVLAAGLAALMGVVGLLAPWLMGAIGSGLSDMSSRLAMMADMFKIFSDRMGDVDEEGVEKAIRIVDQMKVLLGNISEFGAIGISAATFSVAMFGIGTGLEIFHNHTKNLTGTEGNDALNIIQALAESASDLDTISKLDITNLTAKISGLGGAMMLYAQGAKEATGLDVGATPDVTGAVMLLKAISTALVKDGGFTIPENMPSEDAIGTFGSQMAALAAALVMFEEAGQGIGDGTAEALRVLTFFKDLKDNLVAIDFARNIGYIGEINTAMAAGNVGPTELETFGTNIEQLGLALKSFAESTTTVDEVTGEIKPTSYEAAVQTLQKFSELANELPNIGGIKSWWEGNKQGLDDLGSDIQLLGSGLMTFSNKITGQGTEGQEGVSFDPDAANSAISVMDSMVKFIEDANTRLPRLGGLSNFFQTLGSGREMTFKDLGDQIGEMGEGLGKLGEGLNKGGWSQGTGAEYALNTLSSLFTVMLKLQQLDDASRLNGGSMFGFSETLAEMINSFSLDTSGIENMVLMMSRISDEFAEYGDIDPSSIETFARMSEALQALASINPQYDWEIIGMQIDSGVAKGIVNNTSLVTNAATSMAQSAYNAALAALGIASPSKVFMGIGEFVSAGMAIGITSSADEVGTAAEEMGQRAVNSARDMIGTISRIMSEDVSSQPTISPVLDLSNVTRGIQDIDRGFSGRSVSLNTAVAASIAGNAVRGENSAINQNRTSFEGIYQRMTQMNEQLNSLGARISNMRLVLDTGVLAGGVTDGVDENIGRKQFYSSRRN